MEDHGIVAEGTKRKPKVWQGIRGSEKEGKKFPRSVNEPDATGREQEKPYTSPYGGEESTA